MTYDEALAESRRVGAANAEGDALLAQNLWLLSKVHAISPELAYKGAKQLGVDPKKVHHLPLTELSDLQWVEE